jgi:hypothetical protein
VKKAALLLLVVASCKEQRPIDQAADAGDGGAPAAQWSTVLDGLDGALLSIWGVNELDMWTVGGALGNGGESLVLRFDGTTWSRVHPGGTDTYWWVHGTADDDVWMVGENGRATHWNGTMFEERPTGTTATLFGVFAFAPNDVWAVGGIPEDPSKPKDVILHWDGMAWTPEVLPMPTNAAFFKVWGPQKDEIYVVGESAVILHKKNGNWTREAVGLAQGRLTTIYGCDATHLFAVGSRNLLTGDGTNWTKVSLPDSTAVLGGQLLNDVNGVSCHVPDADGGAAPKPWGNTVFVGGGSLKLRLVDGQYVSDFGDPPLQDLHGAWVDPSGAMWGVGGGFNDTSMPGRTRNGVVARYGDRTVSSTLAP